MPYTYGAPRLRDVVGASRGRVRCAVTGYFKAVHTVVAKTPCSIVARRRLQERHHRPGSHPDLVNAGNVKHKAVSEELKQLERKDEEDKETAIAAAEKAAKKLKKKKKKK